MSKEVAKSFSSALTDVPQGWKFDLPKTEIQLGAEMKKSLVADLPKASPYIRQVRSFFYITAYVNVKQYM